MSEAYERIWTYGARPVIADDPETWTEKVKDLHKRLLDMDYTALAPLIAISIDFLQEDMAMAALCILKYDRSLPDKQARAELRKIAKAITRRPGRTRAKLPWGDRLEHDLNSLAAWIEHHQLLEVKKDTHQLKARILSVAGSLHEATRAKLSEALVSSVVTMSGYLRSSRRWALEVLAALYDVSTKVIEKRITRDVKAGRRNRRISSKEAIAAMKERMDKDAERLRFRAERMKHGQASATFVED